MNDPLRSEVNKKYIIIKLKEYVPFNFINSDSVLNVYV